MIQNIWIYLTAYQHKRDAFSSTYDIIIYEGGKLSAEKRSDFQERCASGSAVQFQAGHQADQQHYVRRQEGRSAENRLRRICNG